MNSDKQSVVLINFVTDVTSTKWNRLKSFSLHFTQRLLLYEILEMANKKRKGYYTTHQISDIKRSSAAGNFGQVVIACLTFEVDNWG